MRLFQAAVELAGHAQEIERLDNSVRIAETLEHRKRLVMLLQAGGRLLDVGVPVPDTIEAMADQRLVAELARQRQCVCEMLAGAPVVVRGPQQP